MAIMQDSQGNAYSEDNPLAIAIAKLLNTVSMNHEYTDNTQWKQTHNAVSVGASATSLEASWTPVPEGMTEFVQNLSSDVGLSNILTVVEWSEDGTNRTGKTSPTVPTTSTELSKTTANWMAVGGSFYKAGIYNGDAASHICSANIKFRP